MNKQLIPPLVITRPSNLTELTTNLALIKPNNSETTQIITYTLLATALVGIFVYHYIKSQEASNGSEQEKETN